MGAAYVPLNESVRFATDAVDLLEFANGDARSKWGSERAAMGHPVPFGLRRLEVGNEEADMKGYAAHYKLITDAVWAADPAVHVVASGRWGPSIDGNPCLSGVRCDEWDDHYCGRRRLRTAALAVTPPHRHTATPSHRHTVTPLIPPSLRCGQTAAPTIWRRSTAPTTATTARGPTCSSESLRLTARWAATDAKPFPGRLETDCGPIALLDRYYTVTIPLLYCLLDCGPATPPLRSCSPARPERFSSRAPYTRRTL
jgi:hypothetical protein